MAVSNAIGSNVFDINLGLGLPFLIRTIVDKGTAFSLLNEELQASPSLSPHLSISSPVKKFSICKAHS